MSEMSELSPTRSTTGCSPGSGRQLPRAAEYLMARHAAFAEQQRRHSPPQARSPMDITSMETASVEKRSDNRSGNTSEKKSDSPTHTKCCTGSGRSLSLAGFGGGEPNWTCNTSASFCRAALAKEARVMHGNCGAQGNCGAGGNSGAAGSSGPGNCTDGVRAQGGGGSARGGGSACAPDGGAYFLSCDGSEMWSDAGTSVCGDALARLHANCGAAASGGGACPPDGGGCFLSCGGSEMWSDAGTSVCGDALARLHANCGAAASGSGACPPDGGGCFLSCGGSEMWSDAGTSVCGVALTRLQLELQRGASCDSITFDSQSGQGQPSAAPSLRGGGGSRGGGSEYQGVGSRGGGSEYQRSEYRGSDYQSGTSLLSPASSCTHASCRDALASLHRELQRSNEGGWNAGHNGNVDEASRATRRANMPLSARCTHSRHTAHTAHTRHTPRTRHAPHTPHTARTARTAHGTHLHTRHRPGTRHTPHTTHAAHDTHHAPHTPRATHTTLLSPPFDSSSHDS